MSSPRNAGVSPSRFPEAGSNRCGTTQAFPPLARCHIDQTFFVSLWGGLLIVVANAALFLIFGWNWEWTWVFVIIYFTCVHSTLILLGILGLAKAMAGKPYVYPSIGPRCA